MQRSIDFAMEPNSVGQHVNYLEICEPDVLADDLQSMLRGIEMAQHLQTVTVVKIP